MPTVRKNIMAKLKKKSDPDIKAFFTFIEDLSTERKLSREKIIELIRGSFLTSYQKKYGIHADLKVLINPEAEEIAVLHRRMVAEKSSSSDGQIGIEEARTIRPDVQIGDFIEERYDPLGFSRVVATNIRQTLMQRLREMEREIIYDNFKDKEGELINGYFLRWRDREVVYVDIGRTEGVLPRREQIPGERFRPGDRVKALIKTVELRRERTREPGPFILLSRASPAFVRKLFEMEIPEIYDGVVEIIHVVRQAGYRTKLLVRSTRQDVDPVGACVGIKGVRIQSIVRELGNERVDIVNVAQETQELIANSLSPAEVLEIRVDSSAKEAFVVVSDNSYSVAIGNTGHNVRLACQLTDYNIVVKSQTQFSEEMSSPEAKERLEALFSNQDTTTSEAGDEATPLSDLPGLSRRIIELLRQNDVSSVEKLVEFSETDLSEMPGVGKSTAKQIRRVLAETVEFEDA